MLAHLAHGLPLGSAVCLCWQLRWILHPVLDGQKKGL